MKRSFGVISVFMFGLSLLFLVLLTLFESSLLGLSVTAERILSVLLLVVPALIGVVLGFLGIRGREDRLWMSVLGIILNALFALFHLLVISFAG